MRDGEFIAQEATGDEDEVAASNFEVAIVGLVARMPGARSAAELWDNLAAGVESITIFSAEQLVAAGIDPQRLAQPGFIAARGVLDDAEGFDAALFDINPRDAEIMDPQQRIFLECAQEALDDAGVDPERYAGLIGLFGGCGPSGHLARQLADPRAIEDHGLTRLLLANDKDFLCTRVAYKLGLRGPAITVQTACSSSLVAVHVASQALLNGECDVALAGGVSVALPQEGGTVYQEGGILSPDGHCRAFDAEAKGSVSGHGAGLVVLKRLEDALADGDTVRAVIKGSATNNDGSRRIGFTAPGQEGQAAVVRAAQQMAGVDATSVTLLEAHGTGTELGDPIELAALGEVWKAAAEASGQPAAPAACAIGSIKTNIGHLDAAAGVAGLIKTVLALEHRQLPASLHYTKPNPRFDMTHSPFFVNTTLKPWPEGSTPRRAGVSSFGLGGTNAHVVLEEAPPLAAAASEGVVSSWQLLPLSARSASAADAMAERLGEHLRERPELALAEVASTLQGGRRNFEHRRLVVVRERQDALAALAGEMPGRLLAGDATTPASGVIFLFAGLGEQYVDMGLGLYREQPVFRREVDRCAEILRPELGLDLRQVLYPRGTEAGDVARVAQPELNLRAMLRGATAVDPQQRALERTEVLHPALFVLDYALARLWISCGVRPAALFGYSLGEYVAACLAGVFSLSDALLLVTRRARLIAALPPGAMLAVPLAEETLRPRLRQGMSIAAINGPQICVLAGERAILAQWADEMAAEGVPCRPIATSHAFHSSMMQPIADAFRQLVAAVPLNPPRIPYVSDVSGDWIEPQEVSDADYWVRHLLQPVRFADALATLCRDPGRVLLEVGPGQALSSMALSSMALSNTALSSTALSSMALTSDRPTAGAGLQAFATLPSRHQGQEDLPYFLNTLGRLWLAGLEVDWAGLGEQGLRRRVPLPTYPFEHQQFRLRSAAEGAPTEAQGRAAGAPRGGRLADPADWFFLPSFKRAPRTGKVEHGGRRWLVLAAGGPLDGALVDGLRAAGHQVLRAVVGEEYAQLEDQEFRFDPRRAAHFDALLAAVVEDGELPEVVHLLTLAGAAEAPEEGMSAVERSFFSLLFTCQALGRSTARPSALTVLSQGLFAVEGGDRLRPHNALMLGLMAVLPQEMPQLSCRLVEVNAEEGLQLLGPRLVAELSQSTSDPVVLWRGPHRWLPTFEALHLAAAEDGSAEPSSGLRRGGIYLISGGLGGLGLALAEHLVRRYDARVALLGRTGAPAPEAAGGEPAAGGESAAGGEHEERWRILEELAERVLVLTADVANQPSMAAAVERIEEHFGPLDGVFHLAAVPGQGLMQLKTSVQAEAVLQPKLHGLEVLEQVLAGRRLDLVVLYSSIAAVVGAIGQADYAAANAFLGTWAEANPLRARRCLAIDWGEWRWDGWGGMLGALDPRLAAELARGRELYGLTMAEGLDALERALHSGLPRLVVSTRDFRPLLARRASPLAALVAVETAAEDAPRHARPTLGIAYAPPRDELEEELAALWQNLLGVDRVGIDDPFLEIGGHSLLALQLLTRLRSSLGVNLPLRAIFEASTIAALAERIRSGGEAAPAAASIPRLPRHEVSAPATADLEGLSAAELDALLEELQGEGEG